MSDGFGSCVAYCARSCTFQRARHLPAPRAVALLRAPSHSLLLYRQINFAGAGTVSGFDLRLICPPAIRNTSFPTLLVPPSCFPAVLVERLPRSLAPNLITLAGTLGLLLAYAINAVYLPDLAGDAPWWVFALSALSVVVYVNLDCLDGKQVGLAHMSRSPDRLRCDYLECLLNSNPCSRDGPHLVSSFIFSLQAGKCLSSAVSRSVAVATWTHRTLTRRSAFAPCCSSRPRSALQTTLRFTTLLSRCAQARRTGSSSPLGQLFDHGCDALSVHLLLANLHCSLGLPCGLLSAFSSLVVKLTWVLAQWEEYHTGGRRLAPLLACCSSPACV